MISNKTANRESNAILWKDLNQNQFNLILTKGGLFMVGLLSLIDFDLSNLKRLSKRYVDANLVFTK